MRDILRWLVTFAGFPAGGLTASLVVGPVDGPLPAVLGGLITGVVLGAVQAWGLGPGRPSPVRWIAATAAGMAAGLGAGAALVGYATSLNALVIQGAVGGLLVGAAQALVLRLPVLALALPFAWAIGWAVTTGIGVQVGDRFTVFGSSGAVVVTLLTAFLPVMLNRRAATVPAS